MQQIQQKIELFRQLSRVCLAVCLVCLSLCIFFFFRFKIREIFNVRTGRSVKKKIRQIEEQNARTGEMRPPGDPGPSVAEGRRYPSGQVRRVKMDQLITEPVLSRDSVQEPPRSREEETAALSPPGYDIRTAQNEVDQSHGRFLLKKGILLIHTGEIV